ncbi:MAG: endonuclease/exonuclease/phosphatase family protein [Fimbriimonas sp.]
MRSIRRWIWCLSPAFLLLASWLYWQKPDSAAAFTIFPAWTWVPLGLLPLLWWKRLGSKVSLSLLVAWCAYTFLFSEEWVSLKRFAEVVESRGGIRVVSLNCAGGLIEAAEEVATYNPDIVLLQESPGRPELERLAKKLYGSTGSVVSGPDASILSRWPLKRIETPRTTNDFVATVITTPTGEALNVVSLRLMPPSFRIDLFDPGAWTAVANNRRLRREELAGIVAFLERQTKRPTIIGGDFNAQSGDAVFRVMPPDLKDSFYEAGAGWCHSAVNDYPLARIDQIWLSSAIKPLVQNVVKTVNSDHRMVVLDASISGPAAK